MAQLVYYETGWPDAYLPQTWSYHHDFSPEDTWTVAQLYLSGYQQRFGADDGGLLLGFTHVEWLENGTPRHDDWGLGSIVTLGRYQLTRLDWSVSGYECVGRWVMNLFR